MLRPEPQAGGQIRPTKIVLIFSDLYSIRDLLHTVHTILHIVHIVHVVHTVYPVHSIWYLVPST